MKLRDLSTNEYVADLMLLADCMDGLQRAVGHLTRSIATESDKIRAAEIENAQQAMAETKESVERLAQHVRIAMATSQLDRRDRVIMFERLAPAASAFGDDDDDGNDDEDS